jgi:nucleoside phosphorylase
MVRAGVTWVILAGLGGALDPGLGIGDVVVEGLVNQIEGARAGKIYSADRIVATAAEKRRLFEESGCLAGDMEGGLIGKLCREGEIRMIHVRAISDAANEAVSPRMLGWVDDVGRPRAGRVAAGLALHPGEIPAMIRLGRNSKVALRNMARVVRRIVEGEMGA